MAATSRYTAVHFSPTFSPYLSLHVSLLNSVADNIAIAVVLGWLPLQRTVETPDFCDMNLSGRSWLVWWVCERR